MKTPTIEINEVANAAFDARATKRPDEGCWIWEGAFLWNGYGQIYIQSPTGGKGSMTSSHRYAYTRWVGKIPEGLHIDHLCRNRACYRPDHLEAVTQAENNRRKAGTKATCKYGHAFVPGNRNTQKSCKDCMRARQFVVRGRGSFEEGLEYVKANPINRI